MVRYLINTQEHSLLGVTPFEMVFGRAPDEWRDLFSAPEKKTSPPLMGNQRTKDVAILYAESFQKRLLELRSHAETLLKKKTEETTPAPVLGYGAAVWLLPTKRKSKLAPRLRGPYLVKENLANHIVSIKSLTSTEVLNVHVRRLVLVRGHHALEDLRKMAASSEGEYFIEALVDHRGDSKKTLEFLVQWAGYQPEENTWEPLSELKDTVALGEYLVDHPELVRLTGK
ncbi:hypothetical protein ADUPG1_013021 [Aduncisulcus paluster]|uniref:Chromo domain-containing protein n=1 Tax=Aduncisulcus paluster TaxID=2918883 RepID=A0ABQ5K1G7_9EUKA|nr:hypothetical protein ADUPG1_013021 [Aduncisulcus paluster]